MASVFTDDSETRKQFPVYSLLMYFPDAIAAITRLAVEGNKKHSPDRDPTDIVWVRDKSDDHKECIGRHLIDGDWCELAMRGLMNLQTELEKGYDPFGDMYPFEDATDEEATEHYEAMKKPLKPTHIRITVKHVDTTVGKVYEITGWDGDDEDFPVGIVDDANDLVWPPVDTFEYVPAPLPKELTEDT